MGTLKECKNCNLVASTTARFCRSCGGSLEDGSSLHPHQSRIDKQWNDAIPRGWGTKKAWGSDRQERGDKDMHKGERQMLYDILDNDENIRALVGGMYRAEQDTARVSKHNGVAVATDRRVIFLDKGVLGSTDVSEMPYRSIEGLTHSTGMMFGGVQVTGIGRAGWRIENVKPKESAKLFADAVRGLIDVHHAQAAQKESPRAELSEADELVKWARLLTDGIETQDEFDLKKRQILGL